MLTLNPLWCQDEALRLCLKVEEVCPAAGCHVALTGGLLYKDGPRKDCDLLFYRIRQTPNIDLAELLRLLGILGFTDIRGFGWCYKATYNGKSVDMFFPEESKVSTGVTTLGPFKPTDKTYE